MDLSVIGQYRIEYIEWAVLPGERARSAGCNARLGVHGTNVPQPFARIAVADQIGFGWSRVTREQADRIVGKSISSLFLDSGLIKPEYRCIEFPLLDCVGRLLNKPVYSLVQNPNRKSENKQLRVPCYDTSLYFDELNIPDSTKAIELMKTEVLEGLHNGHLNFKVKVGRGAKHMGLLEGLKRDIEVIMAVREVAGPPGKLMIDANNGYNLNLTKEVLSATKAAEIFWIEEPFHEDPVLLGDLKEWMAAENLKCLIGDGEGLAAPHLMDWAKKGLVDVLQYDLRDYGFCSWLELGQLLDRHNVKSAPHNYGGPYGNYAMAHLLTAIEGFLFVEWDDVKVAGLECDGYRIQQGTLVVPETPGFGLQLEEGYYKSHVMENGWSVKV